MLIISHHRSLYYRDEGHYRNQKYSTKYTWRRRRREKAKNSLLIAQVVLVGPLCRLTLILMALGWSCAGANRHVMDYYRNALHGVTKLSSICEWHANYSSNWFSPITCFRPNSIYIYIHTLSARLWRWVPGTGWSTDRWTTATRVTYGIHVRSLRRPVVQWRDDVDERTRNRLSEERTEDDIVTSVSQVSESVLAGQVNLILGCLLFKSYIVS